MTAHTKNYLLRALIDIGAFLAAAAFLFAATDNWPLALLIATLLAGGVDTVQSKRK
jgi:hypothetical protein